MEKIEITPEEIDDLQNNLKLVGEKHGYFLNPKDAAVKGLVKALLKNEKRYGHQICPCRLTSGSREADLDIICPCDYRDQDILDHGACYCGLYVSKKNIEENAPINPVPERRPNKEIRANNKIKMENQAEAKDFKDLAYPVWRCSVCGYVCARAEAPEICPICGATHDRFQKFF